MKFPLPYSKNKNESNGRLTAIDWMVTWKICQYHNNTSERKRSFLHSCFKRRYLATRSEPSKKALRFWVALDVAMFLFQKWPLVVHCWLWHNVFFIGIVMFIICNIKDTKHKKTGLRILLNTELSPLLHYTCKCCIGLRQNSLTCAFAHIRSNIVAVLFVL